MADSLRFTPDIDNLVGDVLSRLTTKTRSLILIDGASGTGKTSLARTFETAWPADRELVTVHMDDLYPGWDGLEGGVRTLISEVIPALEAGVPVRLRSYDWSEDRFVDGTNLAPECDVIVEGCGAHAVEPRVPHLRVWIEADDVLRRHRALSRPGENFHEHWDEWETQFARYVARIRPGERATMRVRANR